MSSKRKDPLPVIKGACKSESIRSSHSLAKERQKSIAETLIIASMKPEVLSPKRPTVVSAPTPMSAHERLYKRNIRNARAPRRTIRRMRSRSTGDLEQLNADVYVSNQMKAMAAEYDKQKSPSRAIARSSVAALHPTAATEPSTAKPSGRARPSLISKPSQDDSCILMRTTPRRSRNSVASPLENGHSVFPGSEFTVNVQTPSAGAGAEAGQPRKRKTHVLTNLKTGLEKGLLRCVFTGPAVFWRKRLTFTVSVYMHDDALDCFEVVGEDPEGKVDIQRLFVRPSTLYLLKEKYFQSKLLGVSTQRPDLMGQARLHLAGELIVSNLQIDDDIMYAEGRGGTVGASPAVHNAPCTAAAASTSLANSGTSNDQATDVIATAGVSDLLKPDAPSVPTSGVIDGDKCSGSARKKVLREISLFLPYYHDESHSFEAMNIPRPYNLPLCF